MKKQLANNCPMSAFMTFFVITALEVASSVAFAQAKEINLELPAGTELFILTHKQSNRTNEYYGQVINGSNSGAYIWFAMSPDEPIGKLFTQTEWDHLATPTAENKNAFYIHLYKSTLGRLNSVTLYEDSDKALQMRQRLKESMFTKLDNYLPMTNHQNKELATDIIDSCPRLPQQQNGETCRTITASTLPAELIKIIETEAKAAREEPALVAAVLQNESNFDPFIENLFEKNLCHEKSGCGSYRWGKGLAQLGATNAVNYGLDWNHEIPRPVSCRRTGVLDSKCLFALLQSCEAFSKLPLKPINCPQYAIRAIAQKLHLAISSKQEAWILNDDKTRIKTVDILPFLMQTPAEAFRSKLSIYNRGPRLVNSYVEFYDQYGSFPKNYGEAWSTGRSPQTPSTAMGYQILSREYVNRCYIWAVAGICGELPKASVITQFRAQFKSTLTHQGLIEERN